MCIPSNASGAEPDTTDWISFSSSPAESRAILVASKDSSFGLSSIRRRNNVIPAPMIATRFFILQIPPSFPVPLPLQWQLVFLSSSEQLLSLLLESVGFPLVLVVVELLRAFCEDPSPLIGVQLQGTRPTRLRAIDRLCRRYLTRSSCPLCLLRLV